MFGAIAGGIASALAGGAMSKLFGGGQKAASGGIQGDVLATDNNTVGMGDAGIKSAIQGDRKSGSAGMPRPISYAVFCLKKKIVQGRRARALSAVVLLVLALLHRVDLALVALHVGVLVDQYARGTSVALSYES